MEWCGWVHKVIHSSIMHREYKECHCNITAWSHRRWSNTAVPFPREISLWRFGVGNLGLFQMCKGRSFSGIQYRPLLCTCRRDARRAGCHTWSIKHVVCLVRCCTKLLGCYMVSIPSVFSPFLPLKHAAGSAPLPGLKQKYSPAYLQQQRTISMAQPALAVKSHQAKKMVQGTPALHIPNTPCWSVQGF